MRFNAVGMTPKQKLRCEILSRAVYKDGRFDEKVKCCMNDVNHSTITAVNIDEIWDSFIVYSDAILDHIDEFREGEIETGLSAEYGRNHESKSVASQMSDGTWIGWTYWYGGGKHAQPELIDWMTDSYELNCVEEERMVLVRTFEKKSSKEGVKRPVRNNAMNDDVKNTGVEWATEALRIMALNYDMSRNNKRVEIDDKIAEQAFRVGTLYEGAMDDFVCEEESLVSELTKKCSAAEFDKWLDKCFCGELFSLYFD